MIGRRAILLILIDFAEESYFQMRIRHLEMG